ncbi:MAG: L,D-transpeptidase family protein [Xanthomonadaceae bacterium]|jgi:hypothetical protein|nr:L,D-transpeptidase family protein [Xanthomonadaceae bacterium]
MDWSRFRLFLTILLTLCLGGFASPVLAEASAAPPTPVSVVTLAPGKYVWHPEISPSGPVVMVISLNEQLAYVYRNGVAIGISTISSGKRGKETPPGVFPILQKKRDHRSNLYDDAPMPFMQRLTWDGVALHGGRIPGYPASHGCIRLPRAFAEQLFGITKLGDVIVVADVGTSPLSVAYPSVLAPVSGAGENLRLDPEQPGYSWNAVDVLDGPVTVVVSQPDRHVYVLRHGVLVGQAEFEYEAPDFGFPGSALYVLESSRARAGDATASTPPASALAWSVRALSDMQPEVVVPPASERFVPAELSTWLPAGFARHLQALLDPGVTLLLTDMPVIRQLPNAIPNVVPEPVRLPSLQATGATTL